MSSHHLYGRDDGEFPDLAFEARSSYAYEDEVANAKSDVDALREYSGGDVNYGVIDGGYGSGAGLEREFFTRQPIGYAPQDQHRGQFDAGSHVHVPESQSVQSSIVHSRGGTVDQYLGQITPPEDFVVPHGNQQIRTSDGAKLSNEQRARNAANTRHSRTKNARRKQEQDEIDDNDMTSQKQNKNVIVQREKNRVAAAKCRAKKKTANEQQEEMASEFGSTNTYLTREIRELKNQKSELQNFLLAHRPGVCECHGIHDYNFGQAQRLVLNARRNTAQPATSSSRDSGLSTQTPDSDSSGHFAFSAAHQSPSGLGSGEHSYYGQMYDGFGLDPAADVMQMHGLSADGRQSSHEFADFFQNSPGGHVGYP